MTHEQYAKAYAKLFALVSIFFSTGFYFHSGNAAVFAFSVSLLYAVIQSERS